MLFMIRGMRGDCTGSSISCRALKEQRLGIENERVNLILKLYINYAFNFTAILTIALACVSSMCIKILEVLI